MLRQLRRSFLWALRNERGGLIVNPYVLPTDIAFGAAAADPVGGVLKLARIVGAAANTNITLAGIKPEDKVFQAFTSPARALMNRVLGHANVGIGLAAAKARTNSAVGFSVDGQVFTKASTDDLWTLTGAAIPISTARGYLLLLDKDGTASVLATANAASVAALVWPAVPVGQSVIGFVTVLTDGATTFTPGTTALNAAGITSVFGNGIKAGTVTGRPVDHTPSVSVIGVGAVQFSVSTVGDLIDVYWLDVNP